MTSVRHPNLESSAMFWRSRSLVRVSFAFQKAVLEAGIVARGQPEC